MPRKVIHEPIRTLTIQLPKSEFELLEKYCHQQQETKGQVIRTFIKRLARKVGREINPWKYKRNMIKI